MSAHGALAQMQRESPAENPAYLTDQLITCIGNKRSLLAPIAQVIDEVRHELGGRKLRTLDAFSGSGAVSRLLKSRSSTVYANDIEDYARVVSECYLQNARDLPWEAVQTALEDLRKRDEHLDSFEPGFIERLYAPQDEENISASDRVFYTKRNARRLDVFRGALDRYDPTVRTALLGPLLSEASIHTNTAGVFKGFYKDRETGIGRFGGAGDDALTRIRGPVTPRLPILSAFDSEFEVLQVDANNLHRQVGELDLAYIDPPYNQHPYGSNYFMLNLIVNFREPEALSTVSGIPPDWRRSDYNVRAKAAGRLADLVYRLDSTYVLVSYNSEGFIAPAEMQRILRGAGNVTEFEIPYNTFRGSRNLAARERHLTEHLFLVRKR